MKRKANQWPIRYIFEGLCPSAFSHLSKMSQPRTLLKQTDFSIDRILSEDVSPKSATKDVPGAKDFAFVSSEESSQRFAEWAKDEAAGAGEERRESQVPMEAELPWLQCTRYRPPRLPRKSGLGKIAKRRLGSHPRIPFTKLQLQIMEEKYKFGAYLAKKDVVHLSTVLHLPQSRVSPRFWQLGIFFKLEIRKVVVF